MTPLPRDLESRTELVETTLVALPTSERLLLQLHYFEDVGCDTLASMFGITTRAVHVRLFRARERFRALIHELATQEANEDSPMLRLDSPHSANTVAHRTENLYPSRTPLIARP